MQVRSLGQEGPLEEDGNPLQYSCLESPMGEEPGGLQSMGSQSQTQLSTHALCNILPSKIVVFRVGLKKV